MYVIEGLEFGSPSGLIGIMPSGQGSTTSNTWGLRQVYRGFIAALTMLVDMKNFATRQDPKQLLVSRLSCVAPMAVPLLKRPILS